jgi:aspartate racemase
MKTIGLIGGTSWTSTIEYYRVLNEEVARHLGGLHSCRMVIFNVEFAELEGAMLARLGRRSGADVLQPHPPHV